MINRAVFLGLLLASATCSSNSTSQQAPLKMTVQDPAPKVNDRYINPMADSQHGSLFAFLKARFRSGPWASYDPDSYQVPQTTPELATSADEGTKATVTWIGHATVLVQHQGVNLLTDPMFGNYASPVGFAGPKRYTQPALTINELPPIDVVVISHDHYDHLDKPSIAALGNQPRYFVPVGIKAWLVGEGIAADRIQEMDWWQEQNIEVKGVPLTIVATPAQHFSGRGLFDRNKRLWASWLVRWDTFSAWFGGDTGYNDTQFKEIGRRFPGIDLGIIPIGAYAPNWFMSTVHVDPAEAVEIHQDIGAKDSIGVHWGAFLLSAEPVDEPAALLEQALQTRNINPNAFRTFAIGETQRYPAATTPQER